MIKRALAALVLAGQLSGCVSSLKIEKYDPKAQQVGYPHRLRYTQYAVTLTWRVVSCDPAQIGLNKPPLKLKLSADIKEASALDPDQFYIVDPRSLQGLFRTSEFTMEWYEDRTTKSISSSVDDQTGTAIGNVLTGVSKLAAAGLVTAGAVTVPCPTEISDALKAINGTKGDPKDPGQKAITDAAEKKVSEQTLVVTRLAAKAAELGATLDEKTRGELKIERDKLAALAEVLAAEQAKLKALSDVVTDSQTITWPETGSIFSGGPYGPSPAAYKKWALNDRDKAALIWFRLVRLDWNGLEAVDQSPGTTPAPTGGAPGTDGAPDFGEGNDSVGSGAENRGHTTGTGSEEKKSDIPGLPYREPMRVRLDICDGGPCSGSADDLRKAKHLIASNAGLALQGGPLLYLPFRAQTFASIKNTAGFAQSGVLTSGGTSQLRGAGSGVAETAKTAGEQVGAIAEGMRGAETKRLQAAADKAKAQKALDDAEAALAPKPDADAQAKIAAFQTDATLATAEKSMLDAQAALAATKKLAGE